MDVDDDDFVDGCGIDFAENPDDDETAELRPLFPDGVEDAAKAAAWRELAGGDG